MVCFWWWIRFKGMIATIFFYFHLFLSWTKMSLELLITIMRTYSYFYEHYNLLILSNTFIFLHLYLFIFKFMFFEGHLWWMKNLVGVLLFSFSFPFKLLCTDFLGPYLCLNYTQYLVRLCSEGVLGLLVQVH